MLKEAHISAEQSNIILSKARPGDDHWFWESQDLAAPVAYSVILGPLSPLTQTLTLTSY